MSIPITPIISVSQLVVSKKRFLVIVVYYSSINIELIISQRFVSIIRNQNHLSMHVYTIHLYANIFVKTFLFVTRKNLDKWKKSPQLYSTLVIYWLPGKVEIASLVSQCEEILLSVYYFEKESDDFGLKEPKSLLEWNFFVDFKLNKMDIMVCSESYTIYFLFSIKLFGYKK